MKNISELHIVRISFCETHFFWSHTHTNIFLSVGHGQKGLKSCCKAWLSARVPKIPDSEAQSFLDSPRMLETTGTEGGGE